MHSVGYQILVYFEFGKFYVLILVLVLVLVSVVSWSLFEF